MVEAHLGLSGVEDAECLFGIGAAVRLGLLRCENRAQAVLVRRVTDRRGEGPDHQDHMVAQLLELPQLSNGHRVPDVQVRGPRVEAAIDPQWPALLQPLAELELHAPREGRVAVLGALHQEPHLVLERGHSVLPRPATRPIPGGPQTKRPPGRSPGAIVFATKAPTPAPTPSGARSNRDKRHTKSQRSCSWCALGYHNPPAASSAAPQSRRGLKRDSRARSSKSSRSFWDRRRGTSIRMAA